MNQRGELAAEELVAMFADLPGGYYEQMRAETDAIFGEDRIGDGPDPWLGSPAKVSQRSR